MWVGAKATGLLTVLTILLGGDSFDVVVAFVHVAAVVIDVACLLL